MMLLALLLATQVPAPAPAPPPAAKAEDKVPPAKIELTTPFPVRLGSVGPREKREAVFGIRSLADKPFHFRVLDLSIGVTVDEAQLAAPWQPGEVRKLVARVDANGMLGPVKGGIRLGTDDPAQPVYILRYDMVVRPEVAVDAERRSLLDVAPHESPEAVFRFTREGGDPLQVTLASAVPEYLEARIVPEGDRSDLRLTLRPGRLKPGVTAGLEVLKVATNGPRQPGFTLYLDWRVALPVVPAPARVVFTEPRTTLEALELASADGKPFRILEARVEGRGFELLDRPGVAAPRQTLRIRRLPKAEDAVLRLKTDRQDFTLAVPLRYLDPKARPAKGAPLPPPPAEEHHHHH